MYLFRPRLTFLAEAQPRRESVTLNFLGDRTNYKAKDIIGIITNLCCIYLFQIDKLLIYIIYGDRTIIGFVGFVVNRPTDGATVCVRKSASEKELLFVRL
jgi:hypothetical protein